MPRRPRKSPNNRPNHLWEPGQSGNPLGKAPGTSNKVVISEKVREAFAQLLENNIEELEGWLHALAKKSPEKALDIWVRISERFVPMLSRTEITGKDGEAFTPINIQLPNIPKIGLSVGEPSQNNMVLGDSSPIAMLQPPAQPGSLGESSSGEIIQETPGPMDPPVDQTPVEEPSPMFHLPPLELSPNVLKDIQERGDTPLAQDRGMGEPTT